MKTLGEMWKLVTKNYISPKYEVSSLGRVRNIITNEIITPRTSDNGYLAVGKFFVHRMVAELFLYDSYEDGLEVNHKDGNKNNNEVANLEWVTKSKNQQHAWENGLKENAREILKQSPNDEVKEKISNTLKGYKQKEETVNKRMKNIKNNLNDRRKSPTAQVIQLFNKNELVSEFKSQLSLCNYLKELGFKNPRKKILENDLGDYSVRRIL